MRHTRILTILLSAATMMTLASCGGEAKLEKAYISFVTTGDDAAVFEKVYDGKAAEFDLKGVKTNSDGQLSVTWYAFETVEEKEVEKKLDAAPVNVGKYQIVVSTPKTSKFEERTVKHDYEITKAEMPESWLIKGADFPTVIHYTESGSGSRIQRKTIATEVQTVKANITIKKSADAAALVLGTDYKVNVSITSATEASVQIQLVTEANYSGYTLKVKAEKQAA